MDEFWSGKNLKEFREGAGLSREEAAEMFSLSPATYAELEGGGDPTVGAVRELTRRLRPASDDAADGPAGDTVPRGAAGWFPENLRRLRRAAGLSPELLAARAGVSRGLLEDLESGRRPPTWGAALSLANALRTTPDAFIEDPGRRKKRADRRPGGAGP